MKCVCLQMFCVNKLRERFMKNDYKWAKYKTKKNMCCVQWMRWKMYHCCRNGLCVDQSEFTLKFICFLILCECVEKRWAEHTHTHTKNTFVLVCLLCLTFFYKIQPDTGPEPACQRDFIYISYHKYLNYYFSLHLYVDYKHIHLSLRYNLFTLKCRFLLLRTFSISHYFFLRFLVPSFPFCNFFLLPNIFNIQFWNTTFAIRFFFVFFFDLPWGCADGVVAVRPFVAFTIEYSVAFCILTRGRCLVAHVTFAAEFIDVDGFVVDDVESKSNCYRKRGRKEVAMFGWWFVCCNCFFCPESPFRMVCSGICIVYWVLNNSGLTWTCRMSTYSSRPVGLLFAVKRDAFSFGRKWRD